MSGTKRVWGDRALAGFSILVLFYLFMPIITIVLFSFNDPNGKFNLQWEGFTLANWTDPFANGQLTSAMRYSLKIAFVASFVATIFGGLIALALSRYRFKGGAIVNFLLVLPLTTPEVVLGASLLNFFVDRGAERGQTTIILSHILFCVSFVAMTVKARVRGFDWSLEDAAMDLGAPPLRVFARVTLPLIVPGILAAALLSFALSIDDYIITTMVRDVGGRPTFPLYIAGAFQREVSPQINVLATMVLVISVVLMASGSIFGMLRQRREAATSS